MSLKMIVEAIRDRYEREELEKKYNKKRPTYRGSIKHKLNDKISTLISKSLKNNKEGWRWESLLGYTLNDLIKRLKATIPEGYTWEDYLSSKLHLDHIIPIRAFDFNTEEDVELKQCWSLYNLRLYPAKDNVLKGDRINNSILLGLILKRGKL